LPVIQEVTLTDGTEFETVFAGSGWLTKVAALTNEQEGGLRIGDVITSYIPTGETVSERDTLMTILDREISDGTEQFMFAVQREGSLWVASFAYEGATE
jgi:hypothetical protein